MVGDTYVDSCDDNLYAGKTRVTVETIIKGWQQGLAARAGSRGSHPSTSTRTFPRRPLPPFTYGTVAHYLSHKDEVDAFFEETERRFQAFMAAQEAKDPEFYMRQREKWARIRAERTAETANGQQGDERPVGSQTS